MEKEEKAHQWAEIRRNNLGVSLIAQSEIPNINLVRAFLTSAVIAKFDLGINFSTEGGISGVYQNARIDIRNWNSQFGDGDNHKMVGLFDEGEITEEWAKSKKTIFDYYQKLLLKIVDQGSIALAKDRVETIGHMEEVIKNVEGEDFLGKVLVLLFKSNGPDNVSYFLRGLTDEELAEKFIPPPQKRLERKDFLGEA